MTLSRSMGWVTYIWYQVPDYLDIFPPCNPGPRLREYWNSNFNLWSGRNIGNRTRVTRAGTWSATTELRGILWQYGPNRGRYAYCLCCPVSRLDRSWALASWSWYLTSWRSSPARCIFTVSHGTWCVTRRHRYWFEMQVDKDYVVLKMVFLMWNNSNVFRRSIIHYSYNIKKIGMRM